MSALAPPGTRFAVVDTETTGLGRTDRLVEVACVTLDHTGEVVGVLDTLVNPMRDVGPTHLHGISATMVAGAPTFEQVAGLVCDQLDGAVVVAHNLPFDWRMLRAEYLRVGMEIPEAAGGLCTVSFARTALGASGPLAQLCHTLGVGLDGHHRALADAYATAQVFLALVKRSGNIPGCLPVRLPRSVWPCADPVPRPHAQGGWDVPPYLLELAGKVGLTDAEASEQPYLELLDRALADLLLADHERDQLAEVAADLGMTAEQVADAHSRFLVGLVHAACADGVVTDEEYAQLVAVAEALDQDRAWMERPVAPMRATVEPVTVRLDPGTTLVFTGDAVGCTREELTEIATGRGLTVDHSVTKSRCKLLVTADPNSLSGKARKARTWGIPIASVADFLAADSTVAARRLRTPAARDRPSTTRQPRTPVQPPAGKPLTGQRILFVGDGQDLERVRRAALDAGATEARNVTSSLRLVVTNEAETDPRVTRARQRGVRIAAVTDAWQELSLGHVDAGETPISAPASRARRKHSWSWVRRFLDRTR